jgi:hypothetical protein
MEFIFQTTSGLCIGIGKNTTPVAKKNRPRGQAGFFLQHLAVGAGIDTSRG